MRVGMLTSGGDCQSLNATMRGVAKTLYNNVKEIEIIGFLEGYKGLMHEEYKIMKPSDFSGILTEGGTIIGTSRQPFKLMRVIGEDGFDKVEAMKKTYKIEVDCANCAATIERHVAKLKCVKEVTVSYMAQKMLVEYAPGVDEAEAKAEILKTALKVEPDFRFED